MNLLKDDMPLEKLPCFLAEKKQKQKKTTATPKKQEKYI